MKTRADGTRALGEATHSLSAAETELFNIDLRREPKGVRAAVIDARKAVWAAQRAVKAASEERGDV